MWAAQALKDDFVVSLVTAGPVDLPRLNHFYGTTIDPSQVRIRSLAIPRVLSGRRAPSALRGAFANRALKYIASEYDILISAYNPCDFGRAAIHCVADFSWDEELRRSFASPPGGVHGLFHRVAPLRSSYLRLCGMIAPPSGRELFSGDDFIVANSNWTAARLRERHLADARIVYPPVAGAFPDVPHEFRKSDFVCIGRISPEKRIERMIEMVRTVRGRGHNVRLRIVGLFDASPYARKIATIAERSREWIVLEGQQLGEDKIKLLANCRYGIHGCEGEAFGIGVAEMIKAGCITFAPAEGGPAEIVNHRALLYDNDADAVEKICAVLDSEALSNELIRHLRHQAEKFSTDVFISSLREVVDGFCGSHAQEVATQPIDQSAGSPDL
jgi:glycosyltransferase involved in cell wall biosynthesis